MKKLIFCILLYFIFLSICFSHKVNYSLIQGGIGFRFFYENNQPVSYADVEIFSPDEKNIPYQTATTDKNGCFLFLPDKKGKWKIVLNDGLGHGLVKEIEIKEDFSFKEEKQKEFSLLQKIIVGISIIWGITGVVFYIFAKRKVDTK
ncbi:MAG: hypothetical protein RMJ67_04280 [Elusimicrobiota bacterium]|nr:DUF4198 domain-containing protein [Endomicrobiia bacterium]MDW8165710.1 hypothetical protein [Elusimicrobiota bacterium]